MPSLDTKQPLNLFQTLFSTNTLLFLIVLSGTILRLKDLTFQSLWLDEIHTVNEANPNNSLAEVIRYLQTSDQHPPLYFFTVHYWFKIMGFNDFMARLPSVIAGVASILVMYFLGKELRNKNVGLIAAALVSFNFFTIFYSQEARNYIFAFLFCCLSFLYLLKALKNPTILSGVWYGLLAALLLYTHYFGLFIVAAQVVIIVLFFVITKQYKPYLQCFLTAGLVSFFLYAPWLPTLFKIGSISSFWIEKPEPDFYITYFKEYFGYYNLLVYVNFFLILVFLGFALYAFARKNYSAAVLFNQNLPFIALFLMVWIVVSYAIPYLRSIMATPMLISRYTIITLPAFILAIAIGIDLLRFLWVKVAMVLTICTLTAVHLTSKINFYDTKTKQEWREMTLFVLKNNALQYPVASDRAWYLDYYFKAFGSPTQPIEANADYLKNPDTKGIWLLTGHGGNPITPEIEPLLEKNYFLSEEYSGVGTWAKLYVRGNGQGKLQNIAFTGGDPFGDGYRALWTTSKITSDSLDLPAGTYTLMINGFGTKADDVFPQIDVYKNAEKLGTHFFSTEKNYTIRFTQRDTGKTTFTLNFVNDGMNEKQGEDRNFFLKAIKIRKLD